VENNKLNSNNFFINLGVIKHKQMLFQKRF
jgi:hypothetical protein